MFNILGRLLCGLTVQWVLVGSLVLGGGQPARTAPQSPSAATVVGKFVGPGGCAASSCHGSVQPKTETEINQNEYSIWVVQDRHAEAFSVLSNPVSMRIGRILKIGRPDQNARCLSCHSLNPAPQERAQSFDLGDGVGCENCHGPASGWLGPHTTKNWTHQQSVALGMYDMKDLKSRTDRCLTCHLGTPEKFVDHELIAAGHPDLTFELDSFSAVMPRHWKVDKVKHPWLDTQTWTVGQAEQLKQHLNRTGWRARGKIWPEYAELDCFACHHSLTKPEDSWRQETGFPGRRAGNVPWNLSRYIVFRQLVQQLSPASSQELEAHVNKVYEQMSELNPNREEIAQAATAAAEVAGRLAKELDGRVYDQATTLELLRAIVANGNSISLQGERSAEQAAMAVDSLFLALSNNGAINNPQELRAAINGLFQELENPSAYNAPRFAAQMKKVKDLLH